MYDARGKSSNQSGLIFGVFTVAVVAVAFFGVLLMPHGKKTGAVPGVAVASQPQHAVLTVLTDTPTRNYIVALGKVSPRASERLDADVATAIADGAGKNEIAIMMMKSTQEDLLSEIQHLARADVSHFDKAMQMTKSGLGKLSSSRSKWCKGTTYETFASLGPARVQARIQNEFGYGTPAYAWMLDLNTLLLEAIIDAKANPVQHGPMSPKDQQAMQGVMVRLITNPQIMQLMSVQGDQAAMMRAMRNLDMCSLGVTGIDAFQSLPRDTRGRMWGEVFSGMDENELQRAMAQMGAF